MCVRLIGGVCERDEGRAKIIVRLKKRRLQRDCRRVQFHGQCVLPACRRKVSHQIVHLSVSRPAAQRSLVVRRCSLGVSEARLKNSAHALVRCGLRGVEARLHMQKCCVLEDVVCERMLCIKRCCVLKDGEYLKI